MSQLDPSPWNIKNPEAAPAWPVAMVAQPAKHEKLEVGATVLCGSLLFYLGPRYTGHAWQEHMGDLSISDSSCSILHSYHKRLCHTAFSVHSPLRRFAGTHQA
jgi:hypothetical protein